MCYSVLVENDLQKIKEEFDANISYEEILKIFENRNKGLQNHNIPRSFEANFIHPKSTIEEKIYTEIKSFQQIEKKRLEKEIQVLEKSIIDLKKNMDLFKNNSLKDGSTIDSNMDKIRRNNEKIEKIIHENYSNIKELDSRIFTNWFAPSIVKSEKTGQNIIVPLRYRVRPHGSDKEVPTSFNLYNARTDSLREKSTWKNIFMKRHCILLVKGFYEWVPIPPEIELYKKRHGDNWTKKLEHARHKREVVFKPQKNQNLWATGLWDSCLVPNGDSPYRINSFAILTQPPPGEVLDQGHDRCPVFPIKNRGLMEKWLAPSNHSVDEYFEMFSEKESDTFLATALNPKKFENISMEDLDQIIFDNNQKN